MNQDASGSRPTEAKVLRGDIPATAKCVGDVLCVLASVFLVIYGVKSYLAGLTLYSFCLFGFAASTTASQLLYKHYGNWKWHRNFIVFGFTLLYYFLLITGGEQNTGMLWCYTYPLMIFALVGPARGRWLIAAVLAGSGVVLYLPELVWATHSYSDNIKYRYTGSIVFVSALAYLMEHSRMKAQLASEMANENLRKLVRSDELTGTFNRRGIKQKVQLELHRVARDKSEMSLVLCDVDLFKNINDKYGHDVGDIALKTIASRLKETVRVTDVVGRWGGEEFLILLPNTALLEAYQLIERVRQSIAREPIEVAGEALFVSISCGICSTRFFSRFDDLIKAADVSLYDAKAQGRNCTRPEVDAVI